MELILRSCFLVGARAHNLIERNLTEETFENKNNAISLLPIHPLSRRASTFQCVCTVGFFYQPKFDAIGRQRSDDRPGQY